MPCSKCDHLKSAYASALAQLRQTLAEFEREPVPTLAQVEKMERDRQAFERALRALEEHLAQHKPES